MAAPVRRRVRLEVPQAWKARWAHLMAEPARRRKTLLVLRAGAAVAIVGLGTGAYFYFRPVPKPDYLTASMDTIFDYTLLTDEFNRLPVEERLKLIGELVTRLKGMSAEDSVLLAGFASGIAGAARRQIEENVSRLAIDVWDKHAQGYSSVPVGDREAYLEETFLDFTRIMETVSGETIDRTDQERVTDAREQAGRERKRMTDPNRAPDGEELGTVFAFVNNNVGGHASPQQRARGQLMMRDMMRHFRGQDITTGKPKGGPP